MRKAVLFDEFARHCKYFRCSEDCDYECRHPKQEERDYRNGIEIGQCFLCSCPLGIEAEQEDYGAENIDWDRNCSDGIVPEGEYLLVTSDETATGDEKETLSAYDRFMSRYDKKRKT